MLIGRTRTLTVCRDEAFRRMALEVFEKSEHERIKYMRSTVSTSSCSNVWFERASQSIKKDDTASALSGIQCDTRHVPLRIRMQQFAGERDDMMSVWSAATFIHILNSVNSTSDRSKMMMSPKAAGAALQSRMSRCSTE